jgi:hypothetical protein
MSISYESVKDTASFKDAIEKVLAAIKNAYGIDVAFCTPTPNGSYLSDFPAYVEYENAPQRMSEILGFPVRGDESFYELTMEVLSGK